MMGNPFVVAEQKATAFAGATRAVVGHGAGSDMREAEVIHRALALAILLAGLGCPLPQRILATRQCPSGREPVAFVKVVAQPVGGNVKPFRQPDPLLATQQKNLLVVLLHLPRFGRIEELDREVDRQSGELGPNLIVLQRPIHGRAHVQGPPFAATLDLVAVPGGIRHGQAVLGHLAFHGQHVGVIVDAWRDLRPELHRVWLSVCQQHHCQACHRSRKPVGQFHPPIFPVRNPQVKTTTTTLKTT